MADSRSHRLAPGLHQQRTVGPGTGARFHTVDVALVPLEGDLHVARKIDVVLRLPVRAAAGILVQLDTVHSVPVEPVETALLQSVGGRAGPKGNLQPQIQEVVRSGAAQQPYVAAVDGLVAILQPEVDAHPGRTAEESKVRGIGQRYFGALPLAEFTAHLHHHAGIGLAVDLRFLGRGEIAELLLASVGQGQDHVCHVRRCKELLAAASCVGYQPVVLRAGHELAHPCVYHQAIAVFHADGRLGTLQVAGRQGERPLLQRSYGNQVIHQHPLDRRRGILRSPAPPGQNREAGRHHLPLFVKQIEVVHRLHRVLSLERHTAAHRLVHPHESLGIVNQDGRQRDRQRGLACVRRHDRVLLCNLPGFAPVFRQGIEHRRNILVFSQLPPQVRRAGFVGLHSHVRECSVRNQGISNHLFFFTGTAGQQQEQQHPSHATTSPTFV